MTIAVLGSTGMLGQPVTNELIQAGYSVRLIVRDVSRARQLFPQADIVSGDLRDLASLTRALQGIDFVYLNLSIRQTEKQTDFHTEQAGLANLIQAAQIAGVRRIGYLSSLVMRYQGMNGFSWWVFAVKQEAVRLIKASGISYSIFYPSCFMESLNGTQRLGPFVLLVGRSPVKPWYVAAHDYGKQVAQAFRIATEGQNQEYSIQGPEAVTQHEAASRFIAAYRKERISLVTAPSFLMGLGRPFSPQADYGWHITEALNKYPEIFEAEETWTELGKPEITLERFAAAL
ncbi:SDR family oxidoreductase [Spirosoma linguale]|uniref:NmrA family protein n=1 Tax=Spirosoma linguale (strain ATCC 33905 / DSM 74 / LMG 10896 / Claus 1) TaxID=504472 RepID=D2QP30_SPILD|nr:NmrA family protein [Spirosoma linguale DSM 74]